LGKVARIRNGYAFRKGIRDDPAGDTRVLQLGDLDDDNRFDTNTLARVKFGERSGSHTISGEDVLMASRGERATAFSVPEPDAIVAVAGLMVLSPGRLLSSGYLLWYLNHPRTRRQMERMREGSNLRFLDKSSLAGLPLVLPDAVTQKEIAKVDAEHNKRCELRLALNAIDQRLLNETTWQRVHQTMKLHE